MLPVYCFRYYKVLLKFANSIVLLGLSEFLARLLIGRIKIDLGL